MKFDMVLEGGGVKLPALVGGYAGLVSRGFILSHATGTSAGAIIGSAAVAGYSPTDLKKLILSLNFKDFLDGGRFPWQRAMNLLRTNGMYKGDHFEEFIRDLLAEKGVFTFGDLLSDKEEDLDDPRFRWRLKVLAADISAGRLIMLPNDAVFYDIEPDELEVAKAVRMSMSIPFFFRPVELNGSVIVDGGLLSNFPIWVFDSDTDPAWPTFGLLLQEDDSTDPYQIDGPVSFFRAMFYTMLRAHDRKFVRPEDYLHRTISIPVGKVGATDFDISQMQKEILFHSGYRAAIQFLDNWSWPKYKTWARRIRHGNNSR